MTDSGSHTDRRGFLLAAGAAGAGVMAATALSPFGALADTMQRDVTSGDVAILSAASIAEALAVTTYTNIIDKSPFFKRIPGNDQDYLKAARQEEMAHYSLEIGLTGKPSPYKTFYYPHGMFEKAQTTLNTLVTLEDAFIAAYLVGVLKFSNPGLQQAAARIMGIESDHRTLARVIGADVAKKDGGPLKTITGAQGHAESVTPSNNNGYERTLGWTKIGQAVDALMPFISKSAAGKAGFDTSVSYKFEPFTAKLPSAYGKY